MALFSTARRPSSLLLRHLRLLSTSSPSPPYLPGGPHAFDPTIRRLARANNFSAIESHLESLKRSTDPPFSFIVTSYASAGMLDQALSTLAAIPGGPTTASINALLSACNHHLKLFRSVPDLYKQLFSQHSASPDKFSYGILIKSLCKSRKASESFKILKEMQEKNIEITNVTYTTILDSLYKEKKPKEAEKLWMEMKSKGVELDVPAYNVRVMHKALGGGKPEGVLKVVEEMEVAGLKPDTITYNYLIVCYCSSRKFAEARKVYEGLSEKECKPNYTTFKGYILALCKNGDLDGALAVFNDAIRERKVPDLGAVKMLVEGLVKGKKMRAAKRVVTGLRKKFSEDFSGGWLELEKIVGLNKDGGGGGEGGDGEEEDGYVVAA